MKGIPPSTKGTLVMPLADLTRDELGAVLDSARADYETFASRGLSLDITRGKPGSDVLSLADGMLTSVSAGNTESPSGVDTRNYGGLEGLIELREVFAELLRIDPANLFAQGNSSLTLMHQFLSFALLHGRGGAPWGADKRTILCPTPGYDRHFALAEALGFDLVTVPMDSEGPVLDAIAERVATDPSVKGIWLVPMYSNPTGVTISEERTKALLALPSAAEDFTVLWDNAYALHHLREPFDEVLDVVSLAAEAGHPDRVVVFASTSKVSHAGAGVAFIGGSADTMSWYRSHLQFASIGPDKINQLRHLRLFPTAESVRAHMSEHRALLLPRFEAVDRILGERIGDDGIASWTKPHGGYFITLTVPEGTASRIVKLAGEAGVKLTAAGATHPYGMDPQDAVIRLAPSMPSLSEVELATEGLAACIKVTVVEKLLTEEV